MSNVGWKRRSSILKPIRISSSQYAMDLGSRQPRGSRSVERQSKIPTRSSSLTSRERLQQPGKQTMGQKNKSQLPSCAGDTPLSSGKFTPQSYGNKITPSASSNMSKKAGYTKDVRNLQDKEFLKQAYFLVQHYFQQYCPEVLINGTDIKPMTIKMFIGMVNHLFKTLHIVEKDTEPVQFEASSYDKELPYWMKKLGYPGLITKAWLQTVNVPNYWPHVVGLLSWLVKLKTAAAMFNIEEQLEFASDDLSYYWSIFIFKKTLAGYMCFNDGKDEELKEILNEIVRKFYEVNGVDEFALQEKENEIEVLREKLIDSNVTAEKDAFDEAEQRLHVAQAQYQKTLDDVTKEKDMIEETKMKILKKQRNSMSLRREIEERKKEIEELKGIISMQSISVTEIAEIQKKSDYLDKEINCLEKECDDYSQLISRYEYEAAGKRDKILQTTHTFNRNIIQLEQLIPELKDFHIYMDPENEKIVLEMEKMVKSLEVLKGKYVSQCEELEEQNKEFQKDIEIKKQKLKVMTETIQSLKKKNEALKKGNEELGNTYAEKEKVLREESDMWCEKLKAMQEKLSEFDELKEKRKSLEERHDALSKSLEYARELEEKFWFKVAQQYKHVPEDLEILLENLKSQNKDLKERYQQLLETFEAQVKAK